MDFGVFGAAPCRTLTAALHDHTSWEKRSPTGCGHAPVLPKESRNRRRYTVSHRTGFKRLILADAQVVGPVQGVI